MVKTVEVSHISNSKVGISRVRAMNIGSSASLRLSPRQDDVSRRVILRGRVPRSDGFGTGLQTYRRSGCRDRSRRPRGVRPGVGHRGAAPQEFSERGISFPVYPQPKLEGIPCLATAEGLFYPQRHKPIVSLPHVVGALAPVFARIPALSSTASFAPTTSKTSSSESAPSSGRAACPRPTDRMTTCGAPALADAE